MTQVLRRTSADRDLVATFRYLARQSSLRVADRFFADVETTFSRLAEMPRMGTSYEADEPLFADLRFFPDPRHRDYLVFQRPILDGIGVYRVLHGARDVEGILAEEFAARNDDETEE